MTLERPAAFALLALAAPIVVLFLRWRRRRDVAVASLTLWRDLVPAGAARGGLRRLTDGAQLAALLLALAAFATALAGPVAGAPASPARRLVVVLDASATMNARYLKHDRWTYAAGSVEGALERLGPGDEVVVWAASARPRVVVEPTTDLAAATRLAERVHPTLEPAGVRRTLDLARRASAGRSAQFLVLTDAVGAADLAGADLDGVTVGVLGDDRAVHNVRLADAVLETAPDGGRRVRVELVRTDGDLTQVPVRVLRGEDELARADVALDADGRGAATLPLGAYDAGGVVRVVAADSFPLDDDAAFVLPSPRRLRAVRVAQGAPSAFLGEALRAIPEHLEEVGTVAEADLVVAEGALPPELPRDRATLQFGAPGRAVERPLVWGSGEHPVLDGVDLSALRIDRANVLTPSDDERVLVACAEGPVAVARDDGAARHVRLGFRPDATTLPLEPAFPVLVRNAVRWLARPPLLPPAVRAGGPIVTSERLPDVPHVAAAWRAWTPTHPGTTAPRRLLVRDGAIVEPAPLPPVHDFGAYPWVLRFPGLPGAPETAVNWFPPPGFRVAPPAPPFPSADAAVASLDDRRGNVDRRVRLAGWAALAGALALALAAVLRPRRPADPGVPPPSGPLSAPVPARDVDRVPGAV